MRVKVTRNYQITIPSELREKMSIEEGDILLVRAEGEKIVITKARDELPKIRLGRKLTVSEMERIITESIEEVAG